MKTKVMVCAMVLSMAGGSALFAQTAKEVIFRIKDIPANQGKILLTTEPSQYCSAVDATSSAVELKIEDMPNGEYTVYVFHDANSNQVLDKDANQIPLQCGGCHVLCSGTEDRGHAQWGIHRLCVSRCKFEPGA